MKLFSRLSILATIIVAASTLFAQSDNDVLFTVGDDEVTVGEFKYIYSKSNGEEADFSKQSVQEYLGLYQRFKLKVAEAREMGLDTVTALNNELEGYRRQLADNYIIDQRVTDKLVRELYERRRQDIEFSHIFLKFSGASTPADTLALWNRANEIKRNGLTLATFKTVAEEVSDDKFSSKRGGYVGFINPPFPRGLDRLETALYRAGTDEIVGPVQTNMGYHLAVKHGARPALGEMEVAHILVRKPAEAAMGQPVPAKIEEAKAKIAGGEDFARVAKQYSEDKETQGNAGYLGFFGINAYDPAFEAAAFALEEDGEVSDVVETKAGFHLIRRISRRTQLPFNDVRPLLESKVKADDRFARARLDLMAELRSQSGLTKNSRALNTMVAEIDSASFANPRWAIEESDADNASALYTMQDGSEGTVTDFGAYLQRNNRQRASLARGRNATPASVIDQMYADWIDERILKYAEGRLEEDYPEFKALMREYREGILLFEATKMEVWDKASQDTTGLLAYYEENSGDYQWEPRASVTKYVINTKEAIDVNQVLDFARSADPEDVTSKFGEAVDAQTDNYEYDRLQEMEMLKPEIGSVSVLKNDLRAGTSTFYKVESLLPAGPKELDEARGYVIADYQDELERRWVAQLRSKYPVKVNKRTLNKIIQ